MLLGKCLTSDCDSSPSIDLEVTARINCSDQGTSQIWNLKTMRIDCIHDKDHTEEVVLLSMLNRETKLHFAGTLLS